jgi:RNA polymerase sigma-70 factor, ECF subfamily
MKRRESRDHYLSRVMTAAIALNPARRPGGRTQPLYNGWDKGGRILEFHTFDASYVKRLTDGDPETESHFSAYFRKFILMKLGARRLAPSLSDDILQETMLRVLKVLRQGSGVSQPERFGAFVNAICNNVFLEFVHKVNNRFSELQNAPEPADERIDFDASIVTEERKKAVAEILNGLGAKDREILRLVFFEEAGREEISEKLGVSGEYLRVLLHRAKEKFARAYLEKRPRARETGA